MSDSEGSRRSKACVLALLGGLLVVAGILSFVAWNVRSAFKEALYKAYPEHEEQWRPGNKGSKQATWVEARQAWNADAALDVSVFQIILGFVGIAGVAFTVRYTRLAWLEAEKSATAALLALKHSEKSAERQLRAYVTVEMRGATMLPDGTIEASIETINRGQTPAKNLFVKWSLSVDALDPSSKSIEYLLSVAHNPVENVSMMLGPSDKKSNQSISTPFDVKLINEIYTGKSALCVTGIVHYIDAFEEKRETRFAHLYSGRIWSVENGRFSNYGNDYT